MPFHFRFWKDHLAEISLAPFLNTLSHMKHNKRLNRRLRSGVIFTLIYTKIMRISGAIYIYIYYESPKINLLHDIKITIIAFLNKKLFWLSLLFAFFSFHFFWKLTCFLITFQQYQICPKWQSDIEKVNKNKKCDSEFWSEFRSKTWRESLRNFT